MNKHVDSAFFVYVPETEQYAEKLQKNPFQVAVTPVALTIFLDEATTVLSEVEHVVFSGPLDDFKSILQLALLHGFSVGLLPMASQKRLRICYALPDRLEESIDLALRNDSQEIDLIFCNEKILLFKATIGRLPLLDNPGSPGPIALLLEAGKKIAGLRLLPFIVKTKAGIRIETAACGCMIIQHHTRSLASRLIDHDNSLRDGMISLVVSSPFSIVEYLRFLFEAIRKKHRLRQIPSTIGYIKSQQLDIETGQEMMVTIDGQEMTRTPLHCTTLSKAVRLNIGKTLLEKSKQTATSKEILRIGNLPQGKEVARAIRNKIPLFGYASEERFRDLFLALRTDAKISSAYIILLFLSTVLATLGLYQNSSSVVIGAMLLAPLMAPIISLAMALLRRETRLAQNSLKTIGIGILVVLTTSALISLLSPDKPITPEMRARLNPNLLDLGIALVAGIAGAYTKSFKEILQSLAGVAIAVALVPPLAVAGTGLGLGDLHFFFQAFLLFFTNLIGITLAATLTFRVLGYSAAVGNKRGVIFILMLTLLISVPLSMTYREIVRDRIFTQSWRKERFLVNEKYLIVQHAELLHSRHRDVLTMDVLAREPLTRGDLSLLKKKIQFNFSRELVIRARLYYIP